MAKDEFAESPLIEKCEHIRKIFANKAAEIAVYDWSPDFCKRELKEIPERLMKRFPSLKGLQPAELTSAECDQLGFGKWDDKNPIRLIPLYLYPFLADEICTRSINGDVCLDKKEMDTDARFGCLAYGIVPVDVSIPSQDVEATPKAS